VVEVVEAVEARVDDPHFPAMIPPLSSFEVLD
jgi:hypothetical protein